MTDTTLDALIKLLAAGSAFREAEHDYRSVSATKARMMYQSVEAARTRLLQAEDVARKVIDSAI